MNFFRTLAMVGLLGAFVSVAFLIFRNPLFPNWVIYFWPSSIFLLATSGQEQSFQAYVILAVAISLNVLLYIFDRLDHFKASLIIYTALNPTKR